MGQYYIIANTKKREYIDPMRFGDGAKILEFCSGNFRTLAGLSLLLADGNGRGGGDLITEKSIVGSWAGDPVVVAGDYGDKGRFNEDADQNLYSTAKQQYTDVSLKIIEAMIDDYHIMSIYEDYVARGFFYGNEMEVRGLLVAKKLEGSE